MYRIKLLGDDCMMRICIPDGHGEHHVVHYNTMDSFKNGQEITQNGRPTISIGCCLQMKLGFVCILMIADNIFGDNLVISNASNSMSHMCNKVVAK